MLRNMFAVLVLGLLVAGGPGSLFARSNDATRSSLPRGSEVTVPLAPGGAAGIKQAQAQRSRIWSFVPFGVVGALAAVVVLMNDDGDVAPTATGSN